MKKALKVFVAISGGVDSSVSLALLKREGYEVTGVFIKVWHPPFLSCPWQEERSDAMRVCAKLGVPFLTFNLAEEYKKEVIDYMLSEYKKGRTPNPDVMCNREIKFGTFFRRALSMGADYVATGHYAQVRLGHSRDKKRGYKLFAGKDKNKDQSYFLWTLTQKELSRTLFPVGNLNKPEVRKLAEKFGLITAQKKDSQGLCFIGKLDFKAFLKRYIKPKKGKIINTRGEIIGEHEGVVFYTIGERRGFTITKKTPQDEPYYVISKDMKRNILVVGHQHEQKNLAKKEFALSNINWISETSPIFNKFYKGRVRYRQSFQRCVLKKKGGRFVVSFKNPQPFAASGQSLVLYKGQECLGGGIID